MIKVWPHSNYKPALVILDELGYLPIDKTGADLLFQIISHRYEQGSLIITTNLAFKDWPEIFNNDSTLTSALLDRLLHHTETVVIEGKSYRMKETIENWCFIDLVAGDEMAPAARFYRPGRTAFLNRHFYDIFAAPLTPWIKQLLSPFLSWYLWISFRYPNSNIIFKH